MKEIILNEAYEYLMRFENTSNPLLGENVFLNMRLGKGKAAYYNEELPRILMFGSFKSGKSTLVNALTGRKLAAVGPFEKTSWVARYWPSEEEFCYIEKKDGTIEEISVSEFVKNTQADAYDREYLSSIYRVDMGYKSCDCNVALIDTPGIGAHEQNELRALESVGDADLIFYMIDVNKLGKMREQAIVNAIRETNTPMVCIATKYDEDIAEDLEYDRVKKMVAKHTGFEEKDIYPVSVKNYLEGEEDSYFESIIDLCKKTQIHKKDYRLAAQQANLFRQANGMLSYYLKLKSGINEITGSISGFEKQFFHYQKMINNELAVFIKDYVGKTLYAEYKDNIVQVIELSMDRDDNERNAILSKILPANYLDGYMEKLSQVVTEKQYALWNEKVAEVAFQYKGMMQGVLENRGLKNMNFSQVESISHLGQDERELKENGVKWSLRLAGFASFYEAVLGANAASVYLAGAAFTTGIPLAAAGIIFTSYLLKKKKEDGISKSTIRGAVEREISKFSLSVAEYCINQIEEHDREVFSAYMRTLDAEIQSHFPGPKVYTEEIKDCDNIINQLRSFIASMDFMDASGDEELVLRKKNTELKEVRDALTVEIATITQEHTNVLQEKDEKIGALESEKKSLNNKIREKDESIEELRKQRNNSEKEIRELKEKKAQLEKDKSQNQEEISELTGKIKYKEAELEYKNEEIERLREEKTELLKLNEKNHENLTKLIKEVERIEEEYSKKLIALQREISEKNREIKSLQQEIIKLLNLHSEAVDKKSKLEQKIIQKLNSFIYLGQNKYRFNKFSSIDVLQRVGLEDLILFKEEDLEVFMDDFSSVLKNGFALQKEGLNIYSLVGNKYIFGREKRYKAYCRLEGNTLAIKCVDVWSKDEARYREFKEKLAQITVAEDDELKYRIFDEIMRAKTQVVIATPWITNKAWSEKGNYKYSFEEVIAYLLNKNKEAKVYIVTGNNGDISLRSDSTKDKDKETEEMVKLIEEKFKRSSNNRLKLYGDCIIHDKIIVVDDRFSMLGSYNMLSNQCLYKEGYDRQGESMHISENPINVLVDLERASICAKQYSDYFALELN